MNPINICFILRQDKQLAVTWKRFNELKDETLEVYNVALSAAKTEDVFDVHTKYEGVYVDMSNGHTSLLTVLFADDKRDALMQFLCAISEREGIRLQSVHT